MGCELSQKRLRRFRNYHVHVTATGSDGSAVTVFFRAPGVRAVFERVYLGGDTPPRVHNGWHARDLGPAMLRVARRHGLAICLPDRLVPELRSEALIVPQYVCLSIPLEPTYAALVDNLGSSASADLRRVRKHDFNVRITRDDAHLAEFQRRFHAPTINARYGAEGIPATLPELRDMMTPPAAELLQIFIGQTWVAGLVGRSFDDHYRLFRLGWLDGDPGLLQKGVVGAIYDSAIQRTYELGHRKLVAGATLPFLEDGVFAYKAKWGACIDIAETNHRDLAWLINPAHPHLRRFLQTHTVIARGLDGRLVAYGARPPGSDRTYSRVRSSLAAWYQLQDAPDPVKGTKHPEVPPCLQPWFTSESLVSGS
ncbi:MAG: hypothetical protein WC205_09665 [Opitutaceae bacterium]|jgi:hypothetical protein